MLILKKTLFPKEKSRFSSKNFKIIFSKKKIIFDRIFPVSSDVNTSRLYAQSSLGAVFFLPCRVRKNDFLTLAKFQKSALQEKSYQNAPKSIENMNPATQNTPDRSPVRSKFSTIESLLDFQTIVSSTKLFVVSPWF